MPKHSESEETLLSSRTRHSEECLAKFSENFFQEDSRINLNRSNTNLSNISEITCLGINSANF